MGGARNLLKDYFDGTLEEEEMFEPIQSRPQRADQTEDMRHRDHQKMIDEERAERRRRKDELLDPEDEDV